MPTKHPAKPPLFPHKLWWQRHFKAHRVSLIGLFATFGVYFVSVFSRILYFKPDGLYAGHVNIWGDWALHISIAQVFAYRNPADWFFSHPSYAGGKLTYPFLTHLISGLLVKTGFSLPLSFTLPSIVYVLIMLLGLYTLFYVLLKTQKAALTALTLFFFSAGPGFLQFVSEWLKKPTLQQLLFSSKDYSRIMEYQWLAGNVIEAEIIPQRAFLMGLMIMSWILVVFLVVLQKRAFLSKTWQRRLLFGAGVAAGAMPIAHMHSFIVLVIVTGLLSIFSWRRWRDLAFFVVPAAVISSVLYLRFVSGGIENPNFMHVLIGWTAGPHLLKWLKMWNDIFGVIMVLGLAGMVLIWKKDRVAWLFFASLWLIFAIGNLIQFQPTQWDNSKLFLWTYLGLSGLAALVLQWLWRQRRGWRWPSRALAIFLLIWMTATGAMELVKLPQIEKNSYRMLTNDDMSVGEWARTHTEPRAIFLTNPAHDHPISVWGARTVLLGYPGWVYNFGFVYFGREQDLKNMYLGRIETPALLQKYHVSYVAIGPGELNALNANEAYFSTNYPLVFQSEHYRIYDVRSSGTLMN